MRATCPCRVSAAAQRRARFRSLSAHGCLHCLAAGDGPSFPMQQHVPDIANSLLVVLGYRRSRRHLAQLVTLYGVSLLTLAVYCVVVHQAFTAFGNKELGGITRWSGVLASLSVVVLDFVVRPALFRGPGELILSPLGPARFCCSRGPVWRAPHPSGRCCSCSVAASRSS